MGGVQNHPVSIDLNGWMRDIERRLLTQERRSSRAETQRLLGPGFGRYAKQVFDWNDEGAWLSGQFWSDTGALNTPNDSVPWLGTVRAASGLGGIQEVISLDGTLTRMARQFIFTVGGTPTFSAWVSA